jgi:hypothetical protein
MAETCEIKEQKDGTFYCETHKQTLVRQSFVGGANPAGLGHLAAWVCLASGKSFIKGQNL